MDKVYIVSEWAVDWDGWERGMRKRLLVTSDRDKAVAALGSRDEGWEVYAGECDWGPGFYGMAHGDRVHGKRREIEVLEVTP